MPTYNRIEESDRWDIVNYLRSLQGKSSIRRGHVARSPGRNGAARARRVDDGPDAAGAILPSWHHRNPGGWSRHDQGAAGQSRYEQAPAD